MGERGFYERWELDDILGIDPNGSKSWPEDASHENGNYHCKCVRCGGLFVGHKRRVVCKECVRSTPPEED